MLCKVLLQRRLCGQFIQFPRQYQRCLWYRLWIAEKKNWMCDYDKSSTGRGLNGPKWTMWRRSNRQKWSITDKKKSATLSSLQPWQLDLHSLLFLVLMKMVQVVQKDINLGSGLSRRRKVLLTKIQEDNPYITGMSMIRFTKLQKACRGVKSTESQGI